MSFNYSQDQIEEILCAIYAEICELREISAKGMMYRDHYCEGAVSDLVEKGIRQTNEGELEQVLHDYSVFCTDYKACDYLAHEMKINPSTWPTDFDDVKTNFKNEVNQAVNGKFKTKIMRSTSYNSIAVGLAHYKQVVTIGIILTQKAIGVDRVYEARDGVYIQCTCLNDQVKLYGLEILSNNNACLAGPEFIENDKKERNIYHVMISNDLLIHERCDIVDSINFIIVDSSCSIRYGDRSETFNPQFVDEKGASPDNRRNNSERPHSFNSRQNDSRAPQEETKSGGIAIDFSDSFFKKSNPPPLSSSRPPISKPNRISRSNTTGTNRTKNTQAPVVGTTRAMELRMKKNQDKYQNDKRPGYRGLETIKEDPRESMRSSPFSRPNVRNSPVGNYPRRNSPIRNSPRRNSPRRNSPRRNSPRRNSPGRTFEQRRSPLRKPWQIDRNKDTYSNRPFGNSPIGKFGQRDTEVDFSKRNNTGNFIIRSPEISY